MMLRPVVIFGRLAEFAVDDFNGSYNIYLQFTRS